jgi:hypothetical protein
VDRAVSTDDPSRQEAVRLPKVTVWVLVSQSCCIVTSLVTNKSFGLR